MSHHDLAAIVLAAGQGTRIAELSARRPKPLLPLGLTTPLARAVAGLRAAGIAHIVVNASHRAADVFAAGRGLAVSVV
ncbi:MAG: NTP transferase domain-containing protein, partial [Polyangiales bacterium]